MACGAIDIRNAGIYSNDVDTLQLNNIRIGRVGFMNTKLAIFSLAHLFVFITAPFTFRAAAPPTAHQKDNTERNTTDDNDCNFPTTERIGFHCKNKTCAQCHVSYLSRVRTLYYYRSMLHILTVTFSWILDKRSTINVLSAFTSRLRFSYVCPLPQVF